MDTIVFVATSKSGSSREAIKAADRLGYFTVLLTDRIQFMEQRMEFPDVHQMIFADLSNVSSIKGIIADLIKQGKVIKNIFSFMDPHVHTAAALAEEFCTSVVSSDPILQMEDKVLTRTKLRKLPVSPFFSIYRPGNSLKDFISEHKSKLPLIIKSPVSAGSKDVLMANNKIQFKKAMKNLIRKYDNKPILIEEFLTGPQFLVETLVHDGKVHIAAVIEQEITFQKRFIVTGYILDPFLNNEFYENIQKTVYSIVDAFGMKNGACHIEMRLVNGQWKVIEINPRISGGAMNRIIEVGYGINLVEETIQSFLGNKPNLKRNHKKFVYVHYLTVKNEGKLIKVTGANAAAKLPGIEEVFIKPRKGKYLRTPISMGDRYGYVMASSHSKEDAMRIAHKAAREIKFHLESSQNS
ncbi:ATP-grasp domain-containing protein [Bacillus sp. MUM 13]|uniref:ATP-grasp domain-containing protein n=1 Tax=Bacillus sp. MUM 13 TaxID=1678001 RepID=UPI0008F5F14E|nr:ATP-grasp domain-containing protein [Bacillus sp. MUM 13]OIK14896.1 biotin carboxylase [Bacillus sp. MUM 13]